MIKRHLEQLMNNMKNNTQIRLKSIAGADFALSVKYGGINENSL